MIGDSVSVAMASHEYPDGSFAIKCTVWAAVGGKYGSQHVVLIPSEGPLPDDPEQLLSVALTGLSSAVYAS